MGSHTIVEFLIRQGHDDLALQALDLGGDIWQDSLRIAMANTTTTKQGLELSCKIVEKYIEEGTKLTPISHWQAKASLLCMPFDFEEAQKKNLIGLAEWEGGG